jgi:tetratricopeptide (TPR) repeat protein
MKSKPALAPASAEMTAWLVAGLLMLATIAVYWPATRCNFINFDDDLYVTANVHVQNGLTLEGVKWAFTNPVASNWHPFTMLSHMLDCEVFGLNPRGHHLTSVLLHALNVALVFALLRQMTGAMWRSGFVAALFAVHPLHVESVAWVAERKDVLSGFWGLLSLLFYVRSAQNRTAAETGETGGTKVPVPRARHLSRDYVLALFFLALGLMSKAMLVTLPFVMLLLDYWPLDRLRPGRARGLLVEKIPFLALAGLGSIVTLAVQHQAGATAGVESLPLGARAGNALVSYCRYLEKLFYPENLTVFYPHPGYWPWAKVLLAGVFLCGVSALVYAQRRRYPFLLMGWLWFIGMLLPVIGLVQVGDQSMADRYAYLPSLGVFITAVWGAYELTRRWHGIVIALSVACSAAIFVAIMLTQQQLGYWRDSQTLFQHALDITVNNHIAHNNLGAVLENEGQLDEAIGHYREAIRIRSNDTAAHYNLGNALFKQGRFDEAIGEYQEALRLDPDDVRAHINLGNCFYKKGQFEGAISQYQEAIRLEPDNAAVGYNLAKALDKQGQTDGAIQQYEQVLRLNPGYAEAHNNLGFLLQAKGRIDEAITEYQEAIRLKPDYMAARNNLAGALELKNPPAGR